MSTSSVVRWLRHLTGRAPSLEVHVPVRPEPSCLNRLRCLVLTLRRFGGHYRQAPVIATVALNAPVKIGPAEEGKDEADPLHEEERPQLREGQPDEELAGEGDPLRALAAEHPWLGELGVQLRRAPEKMVAEHPGLAASAARFLHDFASDVVLLLDPEVLVAGPFDELVHRVHERKGFAGLIAPVSPLQFFPSPTTWTALYERYEMGKRPLVCYEHTGWPYLASGEEAYRFCPVYFNTGVLCAPAGQLASIGRELWELFRKVEQPALDNLRYQMALGMTVDRLDLEVYRLGARYNFMNHPCLEALHGLELPGACFIHLNQAHQMAPEAVFADLNNLFAFICRPDLRGVNRVAQRLLAAIQDDLPRLDEPLAA